MEFDIVPQIVLVLSAGIIILILGRNISKVKESPDDFLFEKREEEKEKEKFWYLYKRLARRINREKYQEKVGSFWIWLEKVLRKLRINFLRLDNKIVSALDKVKEKNIESDIETEVGSENKNREQGYNETRDNNIKVKSESIYTDKKEDNENEGMDNDDNDNNNVDENISVQDVVSETKDDSKNKDINLEVDKLNVENKNKNGKEKEYIDLILKNPLDIKSYWKLGIIYSRRKNYKDAISCFRQITKIDPTYEKAKKKITDLMERMKNK